MPEWLKPFVRSDAPESPKALVLWQSATGLLLVVGGLGLGVIVRVSMGQPLDSGTVTAFLGACGLLAGLAGFHRQSDPTKPKGGADA